MSTPSTAPSASNSSLSPEPPAPADVLPTNLLTLPIAAYHTSIYVDDDETMYLLTSKAAYRLRPDKSPVKLALDLGEGAVMTHSSFLFWSKGAVWQAPKSGGAPRRLGKVSRRPQYFAASGNHFAWVDRTDENRFTIQTLEAQKPRTICAPSGMIDAMTMLHDWVFFVERTADSTWRFGSIPVAGGTPAFTATKSGRSPAMLVASSAIYYYDGNTREIRTISPDFQHEESLIRDMICSPIAVADRIYCAQFEGLFEVNKQANAQPLLLNGVRRSITAIGASPTRLAWVSDVGREQLSVNTLSLTQIERDRPGK